MQRDVQRHGAAQAAFAANGRMRATAATLTVLLVGLHCLNAYVAYYTARAYAPPIAGDASPFAAGAALTRNQLVAGLLAAQDFVETVGDVVTRTQVLGATLKAKDGKETTPVVTLHLEDGRSVVL